MRFARRLYSDLQSNGNIKTTQIAFPDAPHLGLISAIMAAPPFLPPSPLSSSVSPALGPNGDDSSCYR